MGLFSSKNVYTADVLVSKVIDEDDFPNLISDAIIKSILMGADMVNHIKALMLTQYSVQAKRYYGYGLRHEKDPTKGYINGLPDVFLNSRKVVYPNMKGYLENIIGETIILQEAKIRPQSQKFHVYTWLQDNKNWHELSNTIAIGGALYGLKSYTTVIPEEMPDGNWNPNTPNEGDIDILLVNHNEWDDLNPVEEHIYIAPPNPTGNSVFYIHKVFEFVLFSSHYDIYYYIL